MISNVNKINREDHFVITDSTFAEEFKYARLSPSMFTHEAHLRLAWIHIQCYGLQAAMINIEKQIKDFVKHVGAEEKYHQTITIAAIKMVSHFMAKSKETSFQDFINENPELKTNFKELINSHYSFNIFASQKAKSNYIEPDLCPFNNA